MLELAHGVAANYIREILRDVLRRYPTVTRFLYEVDYVYDDEGGYFPSTDLRAYVGDELEEDASDDLMEYSFDEDALKLVMPDGELEASKV